MTSVQPRTTQTHTRRNRCHLDHLESSAALKIETSRKFTASEVIDITKDYWHMPPTLPTSWPDKYPPPAPFLDKTLSPHIAKDLEDAFTLNIVTYAVSEAKGNLVLEMLGDKAMAFFLAQSISQDLLLGPEKSKCEGLDLGGLDLVFKTLCCGVQQSFFAMLYNFPARIVTASKAPMRDGRCVFSQRDMECTFEAYLAVCMRWEPMHEVQRWFDALIEPWLSVAADAARDFQRCRNTGYREPKRNDAGTVFERRRATAGQVGLLGYVVRPPLKIKSCCDNGAAHLATRTDSLDDMHPRKRVRADHLDDVD